MSQHALLCRHLKKINTFLGAKDGALLRSCSRDLAVALKPKDILHENWEYARKYLYDSKKKDFFIFARGFLSDRLKGAKKIRLMLKNTPPYSQLEPRHFHKRHCTELGRGRTRFRRKKKMKKKSKAESMSNGGTTFCVIERPTEPDYKEIQAVVKGFFTVIEIDEVSTMFVDEEGELKNLEPNKIASKIAGFNIVGNALLWKKTHA